PILIKSKHGIVRNNQFRPVVLCSSKLRTTITIDNKAIIEQSQPQSSFNATFPLNGQLRIRNSVRNFSAQFWH
ncbi:MULTISPECIES: hypothetical protein, partial [unclassified Providencia]|uniref:hypothetical protein n=1 Tax=unclassified Providencia TaxID=2633465 RepID=UPI0023496D03